MIWEGTKFRVTYPDSNTGDHEYLKDFDLWRLRKAGFPESQAYVSGNDIIIEPDNVEPRDFQKIPERGPATERLYADEMKAEEEAKAAAAQPKGRSSGRR